MNVIVLVKQVPDTGALIQICEDGKGIRTEDIKWVINPYDELGIEEAIRIRTKHGGGKVTVLTVGEMTAVTSIRTAYAMGADEGILICDPALESADAAVTARVLAAALRRMDYDLIIAGHRAVDDDSCLVPALVAECLGIPLLPMVVHQETGDGVIRCRQVSQDGIIRTEADLPALMTTQRGLNEPRLASLSTIMKARKTPVKVRSLADLDGDFGDPGFLLPRLKVLSLTYPPVRKTGKIVEGATSGEKALRLIGLLREEAGVL